MGFVELDPQAANRWVARETMDDNTCSNCASNNGKLYKNRQDAYADYPGGSGYIHCIGAEHGNECRGKVVKRKGGTAQVTPEMLATVETMRARERHMSFRGAAGMPSLPQQGLRVVPAVRALSADAPASPNKMYLYDAIGGYDGIAALDVIDALNTMTGDIDLHFNSGGGSVFEGTAIYHAFKNYTGGTIHGYVDGIAGSIASLILMACADAVCEPAATVMVHDASGGVYGTEKEVLAFAPILGMLSQSMADAYAARAGGTAEQWRAIMQSGDTFYTAQAALDAGLVSSVGAHAKRDLPRPGEPVEQPEPASELDGLFDLITAAVRPPTPPVPAAYDVEGLRTALEGLFT
jgi:ATP-dependent protease ClpP protease subunit